MYQPLNYANFVAAFPYATDNKGAIKGKVIPITGREGS
jgi:hypothetical protein